MVPRKKREKKLPFAIIFLAFTNRACSKNTIGGGGQKNPGNKSVGVFPQNTRTDRKRSGKGEIGVGSFGGRRNLFFMTKELFGKGKALLCRSVSSLFLCLRVEGEKGRGGGAE